jgi:dCTP deaminase
MERPDIDAISPGSPLVDWEISDAQFAGELYVEPWNATHLKTASYELTLSDRFKVFNTTGRAFIDPTLDQPGLMSEVVLGAEPGYPMEPFILHPNQFVLGSSVEILHFGPTLAGMLNGKSSLGRKGLQVHATAGWFDPGFVGTATLELSCVAPVPICLHPGMRIAQMVFFRTSIPQVPYGLAPDSHYQGQSGPTEGAKVPLTKSTIDG